MPKKHKASTDAHDRKSEQIGKLHKQIEKLQLQVRHLRNENKLFKSENTSTSRSYYDMVDKAQKSTQRSRELEEQLRQSQKLESLGLLAGGVAHDFNNILTIIQGNTELLKHLLHEQERPKRHVDQIDKATHRAKRLTQQLLAFSKRQVMTPQVTNMNRLIEDFSKMLERLAPEDVEFKLVLNPDLGNVLVDPSQMEQVILNLVVNAVDAMKDGGQLTIKTSNVEIDEDYLMHHLNFTPGSYILIQVTDTGEGMNRETQDKIFEPFFTTKNKSKGTGLGLATVYGIVSQSSGYIMVYSVPGEGSIFKVFLPRVDVEEEDDETEKIELKPGGNETILVVEDEDDLREMICQTLEEFDYTVLQARNGVEGLETFQSCDNTVHLVITDLIMPRLSGKEMAEKLIALDEKVKILYMSGYSDEMISYKGFLKPDTDFMQKPFRLQDLLQKIRGMLSCSDG